jgi:hypothetical protein
MDPISKASWRGWRALPSSTGFRWCSSVKASVRTRLQRTPQEVQRRTRCPVHRHGPGESPGLPNGTATRQQDRGDLSVADALHGDGQQLLHLPHGSGLWAPLPEIQHYFPYNAKLCLNGHEWLKRRLKHRRIGFEALDNGLLSCDDPERAQALSNNLSEEKIDALLRKWLRRLPPFSPADRKAAYRLQISILQTEFSLTPAAGRLFFEEFIGENPDVGRPT